MIFFKKVKTPCPVSLPSGETLESWNFHDLTIHPVGAKEDAVDLKWVVTDDVIVLHNPGRKRTFAYALAVEEKDDKGKITKWYFDPQMVNEGGKDR
jgi:hypothetical protein